MGFYRGYGDYCMGLYRACIGVRGTRSLESAWGFEVLAFGF